MYSPQEHLMKEQGHCTPGVCPGQAHTASPSRSMSIATIRCSSSSALPWDAFEVMRRHWQRAGKNTDGRPGLPWMWLYALLGGVDAGEALNAREMEAHVGECGGTGVHWPHAALIPRFGIIPISPGLCGLGTGGFRGVNALLLQVAQDCGFADASILSSDTTAQELPIGHPNEPDLTGAQRCGRALAQLKTRAVVGVDTALAQVQTILRTVKEHHLLPRANRPSARC